MLQNIFSQLVVCFSTFFRHPLVENVILLMYFSLSVFFFMVYVFYIMFKKSCMARLCIYSLLFSFQSFLTLFFILKCMIHVKLYFCIWYKVIINTVCSAWLLNSYYALIPFKMKLASRSLRQQIKPSVTIKLHLNQNGDHSTKVLQTDPATLLHLVQQLEQALEEMKTNHCRRVVRNIK